MSFQNIYKNDFGQVAKITFTDVDTNAAADISSYSVSQSMIFTDPSGTETAVTAAFATDGTDGIIQYTVADGLFDVAGDWTVRGKVVGSTATLSTEVHRFYIGA